MASDSPLESLRQVWTPDKEIEEVIADLNPGSELDSLIRDFFSRIIGQLKQVTLDLSEPNTGNIRWEIVHRPIGKGQFKPEVTIWWEPDERTILKEMQ